MPDAVSVKQIKDLLRQGFGVEDIEHKLDLSADVIPRHDRLVAQGWRAPWRAVPSDHATEKENQHPEAPECWFKSLRKRYA